MKAPKFDLPEEFCSWVAASEADSFEPVLVPGGPGEPRSVVFSRAGSIGPPLRQRTVLMRVWADQLKDGLHFYVSAFGPSSSVAGSPPTLHLALRKKPMRLAKMSATSALAVPMAMAKHKIQAEPRVAWMRKAHAQILQAVEEHGANTFSGMGQSFLALATESMRLIDRAMNKDVEDAIDRVKKDFQLLGSKLTEDDVVRLWRETIVSEVHVT